MDKEIELLNNDEIFKRYNNDLFVSNFGRVYNCRLGRFLSLIIRNDGYVAISHYGKHIYVHRLV
uniref:HNH endonuclease n=1 Tax=Marinitoga okinawensis TaxID=389480 RepID=A0A9C7GWE6_9BACT|nr:HNH endonuclease [Marinitoga okinawensis]